MAQERKSPPARDLFQDVFRPSWILTPCCLYPTEDAFLYALSSNNAWAGYKAHQNPSFFSKLASGQSPQIPRLPLTPSFLSMPTAQTTIHYGGLER
ncbi:hypothetical protein VTK73DRAFT_3154 [Phialemonium thermophilum]|uniref:Uncharacterized protein n=1 Tax=Phialemonium thermophilum TaxID=223376 RepID=A0ABR3VK68_9PEZI